MRRALYALGFVCLAPAYAQEAVIDVPVRVVNVDPAARVGSVSCAVFADRDGPARHAGYLGTGSRLFELKGGAYAGTVAVPVRFESPGTPRAYRCSLYLVVRQGDRARTLPLSGLVDPLANEYRDAFRRAPGAPFVPEVRGEF